MFVMVVLYYSGEKGLQFFLLLEINSEEILLNTCVNTYRMRDIVGYLCQNILFDNSRKIQKYLL